MTGYLPPLRQLLRHAFPHLLEGTLAPVGLFYAGYVTFGLPAGLAAALLWAYAATLWRVVRRREVSGLLVLSVVAVTARTVIAALADSAFVYFLQPTLGTFVAGGVFAASALSGRPLTERLAADLIQLPALVAGHPAVRRLHIRLSLLWGLVFAINGGAALGLLISQSLGTFLVAKAMVNLGVVAAAVAVSTVAFRRCVRTHVATA